MVTRKPTATAPTLAQARKDLKAAAHEAKQAVVHELEGIAGRVAGKLAAARKAAKTEIVAVERAARQVVKKAVKAKAGEVYAASSRRLDELQAKAAAKAPAKKAPAKKTAAKKTAAK